MESKSLIKKIFKFKNTPLILVFILLLVFFQLMNPYYLSLDNISGILMSASTVGMLAIGLSGLIIGGEIDLSAGAIGCSSGIVVALIANTGLPAVLVFVCAILFGALVGAINAFLIVKLKLKSFIVTLAMSSVLQGVARILSDSNTIPINNPGFCVVGSASILRIPMPFIIVLVLFIIYGIIFGKTKYGRRIYMCGGNPAAARLAGINTDKVRTILFINSAILCALCGAILSSRMFSASPASINGRELDAITAIVLGGIAFTGGSGKLSGCVIAMLMVNAFNFGLTSVRVPSSWTVVAQGVLLIIALMLDYFRERARLRSIQMDLNSNE